MLTLGKKGRQFVSARGEIIGIQYLRGLAALAVVFDHCSVTMGQAKYFGSEIWGGALVGGRIGADLFFMISGFIITIVSLEGPTLAPAIGRRQFFLRRFVRIVPLMWLAILSYAVLRVAGRGAVDFDAYLRALFLLPFGTVMPLVIWTLRQEAIFYLVFALTMLGPRKLRFLMPVWVLSPILAVLMGGGALGNDPVAILFHPSALEFGAGMLLAILWMKRTRALEIRLPIEPLVALTIAFCLPLALTVRLGTALNLHGGYLLLVLSCLPAMVLGIHVVCPPGIGQRIGRMLGDASYAIYLFHPATLSVAIAGWARLAPATPAWVVVLCGSAVATGAGIAIHLWIERPLVGWGHRRFAARRADARPAHPSPH